MAEGVECWAENDKNGVKVCGLHKVPLQNITVFEQVPPGGPYPNTPEEWRRPKSESDKTFKF